MFRVKEVVVGSPPERLRDRRTWPIAVSVKIAYRGCSEVVMTGTYALMGGSAKPMTFEFDRSSFGKLVELARELGATDPAEEVRKLQRRITTRVAIYRLTQ